MSQPRLTKKLLATALCHHALLARGWERRANSLLRSHQWLGPFRKAPSTFQHSKLPPAELIAVFNDATWRHAVWNPTGAGGWLYLQDGRGHRSLAQYLNQLHSNYGLD